MAAQLRQIERLNPHLNAIVAKLEDDACLRLAEEADRRRHHEGIGAALHGLPWAFKDLEPATGFPWTRGSLVFRDHTAPGDSLLVARLRRAGVLPIGKTNVPELGMGSQTYNTVYGTTRNAWDATRTAGGSSGGAAVAVACGMLAAADGSDLGGSLRNPANFNGIVGFRPSVDLVPTAPTPLPFLGLAVKGPIARSVADVALLLSLMAGPDPADVACQPSDPTAFAAPLGRSFRGTRIAWCPDLGGLPLDRRVRAVLDLQRRTFESLGCIVEETAPDLTDAEDIFLVLRAWRSWTHYGALLPAHRATLKPEAVEEIERGAQLSGAQLSSAMVRHALLLERVRRFQQSHPFIVCAVNQLPPFEAQLHWPTHIEGVPMEHYIAWMKSAYWISATHCPAISVPAGFTAEGLPVGIQIVGPYREDFALLQLAHAFEMACPFSGRRPPAAAPASTPTTA
jgi:amidase